MLHVGVPQQMPQHVFVGCNSKEPNTSARSPTNSNRHTFIDQLWLWGQTGTVKSRTLNTWSRGTSEEDRSCRRARRCWGYAAGGQQLPASRSKAFGPVRPPCQADNLVAPSRTRLHQSVKVKVGQTMQHRQATMPRRLAPPPLPPRTRLHQSIEVKVSQKMHLNRPCMAPKH